MMRRSTVAIALVTAGITTSGATFSGGPAATAAVIPRASSSTDAQPQGATPLRLLRKRAIGGYRLIEQPLVVNGGLYKGDPVDKTQRVVVYARFNRRLPRGDDDGYGAAFMIGASGPVADAGGIGAPRRHCYNNILGYDGPVPVMEHHPKDGTIVPLRIFIHGVKGSIKIRVPLRIFDYQAQPHAEIPLLQKMGCRGTGW